MNRWMKFVAWIAISTALIQVVPAWADEAEITRLYEQAKALESKHDYAGAIRLHERGHQLVLRMYGPNTEQEIMALYNVAETYVAIDQMPQAEAWYRRIIQAAEMRYGKNHHETAKAMANLGAVYENSERPTLALPLLLQALQIEEGLRNGDPSDAAFVLQTLCKSYKSLGRYAEAEAAIQRSIALHRRAPGKDPTLAIGADLVLADLYQTKGQRDKAEAIYLQSLKKSEQSFGRDHLRVGIAAHDLALTYFDMQRYPEAEANFARCLKIVEAKVGKNTPQVGAVVSNIANVQTMTGRFEEAEGSYRRALAILENAYGEKHSLVANNSNNFGDLLRTVGRYGEARRLYDRALHIFESIDGKSEPVSLVQQNIAMLCAATEKVEEAMERFDRSRRLVRRHVARVLPLLAEHEQLAFLLNTDREHFITALSFGLQNADHARIAEQSAGWLANGKATAEASLAERTLLGRDPMLIRVMEQLKSVRAQLAALTLSEAAADAARKTRIAQLTAEEQELSKHISRARREEDGREPWIAIEAIRGAVPTDGILIDIARFEPVRIAAKNLEPKHGPARYIAWLIPAVGRGDVRIVDLGPAEPIESAVAAFQAEMEKVQSDDERANPLLILGENDAEQVIAKRLAELSKLVLAPLDAVLQDKDQLILCPDAALCLVPWAAFPIADGKYAVERWRIRFVTAGREVVLEKSRAAAAQKPNPPRVLANPSYDADAAALAAAFKRIFERLGSNITLPTSAPTVVANDLHRRSAGLLGRAVPLPGTAIEAAFITPYLKEFTQEEPRAYLESEAQESIFKRFISPRVLVLSTHGFFMPDQPNAPSSGKTSLENSLLRCGLLLAGCNQRGGLIQAGMDDGILTGMEIVGTDLRNTEMVVLSACQTGLGRVHEGEGVTGLRQAFQLSGARAVVSTLWQIPDRESALIMKDFFAGLAAKETKAEALRAAQIKRIEDRRDKYGAAHPLYWAAWTLTGE